MWVIQKTSKNNKGASLLLQKTSKIIFDIMYQHCSTKSPLQLKWEKLTSNIDLQKLLMVYYPNNEIRLKPYTVGYRPKTNSSLEHRNRQYFDVQAPINLDISDCDENIFKAIKDNSHCDKPGYGTLPNPTKFGLNAKRTLLRIGGTADKLYDKNAVFLTGTLPGSTQEAMDTIARYSAYIINRALQYIRRISDNNAYMYVWELQKRGALHLHLVMFDNDKNNLALMQQKWWEIWRKIINDICDKSGVDLWQKSDNYSHKDNQDVLQADSQLVEKNVTAYLSKYLGKDSGKDNGNITNDRKYYPSRWWGCSQYLRDKLKEFTKVISIVINRPNEILPEVINELKHLIGKAYNYCHKYTTDKQYVLYSPENSESLWEKLKEKLPINQSLMNGKMRYQRMLKDEQIKIDIQIAAEEIVYGKGQSKYAAQRERHEWHLYSKEYSRIVELWNSVENIDDALVAFPDIEKFADNWYDEHECTAPMLIYMDALNYIAQYG